MSTEVVKTAKGVRVPPRTPEERRASELSNSTGAARGIRRHSENAFYEPAQIFDRVIDLQVATAQAFRGVSHSIRDVLAQRWMLTRPRIIQSQSQTRLLPVHGISSWSYPYQQHNQPVP
jgi:hypothetical protein